MRPAPAAGPAIWRPRSTNRPASGSSWPAGRGSAWAATSSASAPKRWSPTTATAHRVAGRRSGSSTPRAASGTRVSPGTPCCSTRRRPDPIQPPHPRPPDRETTTMRRLHLFVPHLPLGLARSRRSEPFPTGPLVLGGRPWDPGPVIDPSPAGSGDPADAAFGQFELGIDGLEPLWGPEPVLIERAGSALRGALPGEWPVPGIPLRIGVAGTHFAATIAAVTARPDAPVIVPPGAEAAFLADRPSGLLTTDPDIRARLARFGLRRIGAVADVPRSALIARFGDEGTRLHARARGEETDPFRARRTPERLAFALPIEPPVEDLEPLRFVLHRLVAALTAQLTGRGLAADRALLSI